MTTKKQLSKRDKRILKIRNNPWNNIVHKTQQLYPEWPRNTIIAYLKAIDYAIRIELIESKIVSFHKCFKLFLSDYRKEVELGKFVLLPLQTIKCRVANSIKRRLSQQEVIENFQTPTKLYSVRLRKPLPGIAWKGVQDSPVRELNIQQILQFYKNEFRG